MARSAIARAPTVVAGGRKHQLRQSGSLGAYRRSHRILRGKIDNDDVRLDIDSTQCERSQLTNLEQQATDSTMTPAPPSLLPSPPHSTVSTPISKVTPTPIRTLRSATLQQATPAPSNTGTTSTPQPEPIVTLITPTRTLRSSAATLQPATPALSISTPQLDAETIYNLRSSDPASTTTPPEEENDSLDTTKTRYTLRSSGPLSPSHFLQSISAGLPSCTKKRVYPPRPIVTADCVACGDAVNVIRTFTLPACTHTYCRPCMRELILLSIPDEASFPPKCCGELPSSAIAWALTKYERGMVSLARTEYATPMMERLYCHKPSCGKFVQLPKGASINSGWGKATCRKCRGNTCIGCRKEFHLTTDCKTRGKKGRKNGALTGNALKQVLATMGKEGWRRCHKCQNVVERNGGCNHMTCRCGAMFCYNCGRKYGTCRMIPIAQENNLPPKWVCVPKNQEVLLQPAIAR